MKRVEDLEQLNHEEIASLNMQRFDRSKFVSVFITDTPHHGASKSSARGKTDEVPAGSIGFKFESGKHLMFSYQWDSQELVLKVRNHFANLSVPTWMDIDGCGLRLSFYCRHIQSNAKIRGGVVPSRYC